VTVDVHIDTGRLNRILHNLGGNTRNAVRKVAFRVEAEAKVNIREHGLIDTGAMLNSVYTTIGGESTPPPTQAGDVIVVPLPEPQGKTTAHVGPSVLYAIYHEFGTHRMAARPYLAPAVETVAGELERNPDLFRGVVTDER
jgi:phage gpG-like protein